MSGDRGGARHRPRAVLVAVGPAPRALDPLVRYATAEALRTSSPVHVVHVVRPGSWSPLGGVALVGDELRHVGRARLQAACVRLGSTLGPDIAVSGELCPGLVVPTLVSRAGGARLLVTGLRPVGRASLHRVRRSVPLAVAARAPVPVVVVPDGWSDDLASVAPVVVVGVDVTDHGDLRSAEVIGAALAEAARRGARLRLVHGRRGRQRWRTEQVLALCGPVLSTCREVPVDVVVAPDPPVTALLAHSYDADVTVVGRRRRPGPAPLLGPVAHGVVRWSARPTMVVPPVHQRLRDARAPDHHAVSPD